MQKLAISLDINEFLPNYRFLNKLSALMCSNQIINEIYCYNMMAFFFGFNRKEINLTSINILVGHMPAGASIYQLIHYGQEINSRRFCQYDYGTVENLKRYNDTLPPSYNVSSITTPLYLFYSIKDWFTDYRDVQKLKKELISVKADVVMDDVDWTHLDFILGESAKEKLYDRTIEFMKEYI